MSRDTERMANNTLNGLAMGAMLFLGGLFLTVWSWGLAAPLGIPLMLIGIIFPFAEAYMARQGRGWTGREKDRSVVMSRKEATRYLQQHHKHSLRSHV